MKKCTRDNQSGGGKKIRMKVIWIIDHYSSEPKYGGIQRQFDFANAFSKRGYKTVIISSAFSHYTHSYISEDQCYISRFAENAFYAYLHTRAYKNNRGMGRVLSMFSFVSAVMRNYKMIASKLGKPDIVVGASVHPLTWIVANHVAKKFGVRFIAEVRDLWPEMWLLNGEKGKLDPMVLFFGIIEKWAYRKADKIIYSMLYGDRYICGKLGFPQEKVVLIGQPMDCERFDRNAEEKKKDVPGEIREFVSDSFTCVFTGYFMPYEGVHVMLKAAKVIHDKGEPIKFLFIGSGQEGEPMRRFAEENHLENVLIHGRVSKELIPSILRSCDICLAHCAKEGQKESFKYGISKNKVNEYLYSGRPVIYGRDDKLDPVAKYGAGYVIEPFNSEEFVRRIEEVYAMDLEQRAAIGKNGMEYSVKYHSIDVLADKWLKELGI